MKQYLGKLGLVACALAMLTFFSACEKEAVDQNGSNTTAVLDTDKDVREYGKLTESQENEILEHFNTRQVNTDIAEEVVVERPDGTVETVYMVDGDIEMNRQQYQEFLTDQDTDGRQYHTNALVSQGRTIRVIGYTGSGFALTSRMRTGLQWAINNYNALGSQFSLNFTLSFSASTNADIVVYNNGQPGGGGSAGFPSGGRPYKWVQIRAGLQSYSTNVNEHVICHEVGHCIGMRHTAYFSRQSCGQNTNEGSGGVGANHISGTPTGYDANSLMLACFNNGEDGEFGNYDRIALRAIY